MKDTARHGRLVKAVEKLQARHRGQAARKEVSLMRRASLASLSALDLTEKEAAKPLSIGHGGGMSALLCVFFAAVAISDELQGCFAAGIRGTLDEDVSMVLTFALSGVIIYRAAKIGIANTIWWCRDKLKAVGEHYEAILGLVVFWHLVYPNIFQSFVDKRIRELIEIDCGTTRAWCPWEIEDGDSYLDNCGAETPDDPHVQQTTLADCVKQMTQCMADAGAAK